jgi:nucleoside-diphosphate-sugar epimerase
MKNRVAIVTGATSFIGVTLCEYLLSKQYNIFAIVRKNSMNIHNLSKHPSLHIVYSDISNLEPIISIIQEVDVFFNLAWDGRKEKWNDEDVHSKNVSDSLNAICIANRLHCRAFVQFGSQAEYGFMDGLITEDTLCNPQTGYGKAKLTVCQQGAKLAKQIGIKYIHLRIFSLYGEYDHERTLIMTAINKMLANQTIELLSDGKQNWNYLYVRDAVCQIESLVEKILACDNFTFDIFHIASRDTRSIENFLEEMLNITQSNSIIKYNTINSTKTLSLSPSIAKIETLIGKIDYTPFKDGIRNIIHNIQKTYNKY